MIAEAPGSNPFPATNQGPSIFNEIMGVGSGDYQYYRQANGWITSGPIGKNRGREAFAVLEGWTPLGGPHAQARGEPDYGVFDLLPYYVEAPFEVLFMRGGAREMPVEQVMALGFHLHPPLVPRCRLQVGPQHKAASGSIGHLPICWRGAQPVEFPQLAGRQFAAVPQCDFCEADRFASTKARLQHIRVMHKDELKELLLAQNIAQGVASAMGNAPAAPPEPDDSAERAKAEAAEAEVNALMLQLGVAEADDLTADDDAALLAASEADSDEAPKGKKRK